MSKNFCKIALDIDDTIAGFFDLYRVYFPKESDLLDQNITKNVYKLRHCKDFWENLPLIDSPNFVPHIYATKRINSKEYTRNWLINNNLPVRPIYQMYYQQGNKADMIKGRCDLLIDDSVSNVVKAINSGLPALIIDRPHNQGYEPLFRIYSLDINEIMEAYHLELETLGWN
jgi:hypothetical protein